MGVPADIDLCAMVSVAADGSLEVDDGSTQVTRDSQGTYTMTIPGEFPANELVLQCYANAGPGASAPQPSWWEVTPGTLRFNVFDSGGVLADLPWSCTVYRVIPTT